jgi:hypothetical protein
VHIAPPAQLDALLCHTTGVTPSVLNSKESLFTGKRKTFTGAVLVVRFCSRWNCVFFEASEICELSPAIVGGQTTAG